MRLVVGYLCLGISAFLFLSVLSFHPQDTAILVSTPNVITENIGGKLGATVSAYLVIAYGYPASLLLSFGLLVVGLHILAKSKIGQIWVKIVLFFVDAISLSVISCVLSPHPDYRSGGLVGMSILTTMETFLSRPLIGGIFMLLFLWSMIASLRFVQRFFFAIIGGIVGLFARPERNEELDSVLEVQPDDPFEEETPLWTEPQEIREEPEFLKRPAVLDEERQVSSPAWLLHPQSAELLKQELASLCEVESESAVVADVPSVAGEALYEEASEESMSTDEYERSEEVFAQEEAFVEKDASEKEEDLFSSGGGAKEVFPHQTVVEKISLRDDSSSYRLPSPSLLEIDLKERFGPEDDAEVKMVSSVLERTFKSFKVDARVVGYSRGPAITRYEVQPPMGLKLRSITALHNDLVLNLGDSHIRIVFPIGDRGLIGIEVPNRKRRHVLLREVIESEEFQKSQAVLPLILGKDITGNIRVDDLVDMPHLLIAGTTGSGKSVYVNAFLASLLFKKSYEELRFILIDPKMVELELYNGLPHLLAPVVTQPEVAIVVLEWVTREMDRRYKLLSEHGVRNIVEYNQLGSSSEKLYFLLVIIDEFADLMLRIPKETERLISRLAAMARAVGIHLIVATQRPSVDVVTGIIKANFPSRIAFRVSSQTDSRTILDRGGAEQLLGKGDMLFLSPKDPDMLRIQAPYVSGKEIETLVYDIKRQKKVEYLLDIEELMEQIENPSGDDDGPRDPLFEEALRLAAETGEVSASFLQRKLRIGYTRAARMMDMMENMHILGPSTGTSKPRPVLISPEEVDKYLVSEE